MKAPIKIVIVAAVAVAVVGAVVLKKGEAPGESRSDVAATAAGESAEAVMAKAGPVLWAKLPKLLDLGADKCIPCKMMAPLLEELKKEYAGRMQVEFIDEH